MKLLSLTSLLPLSYSYNLEYRLPIIRKGPKNSKFGYTVGSYKSSDSTLNNNFYNSFVITGAPQDPNDNSLVADNLSRANNPGAIYSCRLSESGCQIIDLKYSNVAVRDEDFTNIEYHSSRGGTGDVMKHNNNCTDQWLGASLATSVNQDGLIIACAPRWKQRKDKIDGPREQEKLAGQCWLMQYNPATKRIEDISGVNNRKYFRIPVFSEFARQKGDNFNPKKYFFKHAAFGSGVALSDDESTYAMGGPGAWSYAGSTVAVNLNETSLTDDVRNRNDVSSHRSLNYNYYQTEECSELDSQLNSRTCDRQDLSYSSYQGFRLKISKNLPNYQGTNIYVSAAPNSDNTGELIFLQQKENDKGEVKLVKIGSIKGRKIFAKQSYTHTTKTYSIGTSFGYDFAFADINGDGLDDVIIGAPQYYEGRKGGAIVAITSIEGQDLWDDSCYEQKGHLTVFKEVDSYFGSSIINLGDINGDNLDDIAVGAPYASASVGASKKSNANGAVFIFNGNTAHRLVQSQEIKAEDVYQASRSNVANLQPIDSLQGFGFSLGSNGINLDNDNKKFADLIVGSLDDKFVVIRSRPVIDVNIQHQVAGRDNAVTIDIDNSHNIQTDDKDKKYIDYKVCFTIDKQDIPQGKVIELQVEVTLDLKYKDKPRAVFHTNSNVFQGVVNLDEVLAGKCLGVDRIYLEEPMVDILSPIDISVTFKHNDFAVDIFNSVYENLDSIPKIKEQTSNTKIEIANDCSGKVCHAKLVFNDVFIETHNNGGYRPIGIHDDIIVDTGSSQADTAVQVNHPRLVVELSNDAKDNAYSPGFEFIIPDGVQVQHSNIEATHRKFTPEVVCLQSSIEKTGNKADTISTNQKVSCTLTKPLPPYTKQPVIIKVPLDFSGSNKLDWEGFSLLVKGKTSSNQEQPPKKALSMKLTLSSPVTLQVTKGHGQDTLFVEALEEGQRDAKWDSGDLEDIGDGIDYTIYIRNEGYSDIDALDVKFQYPAVYGYNLDEDRPLLYWHYDDINGQFFDAFNYPKDQSKCYIESPKGDIFADDKSIAGRSRRASESESDPSLRCKTSPGQLLQRINCDDGCFACNTIVCPIHFIPQRQAISLQLSFRLIEASIRQEVKDIPDLKIRTTTTLVPRNEYTKLRVGDNLLTKVPDLINVDNQAVHLNTGSMNTYWLLVLICFIIFVIIAIILLWCLQRKGFFNRRRRNSVFTVEELERKSVAERRKMRRAASKYHDSTSEHPNEQTALMVDNKN